jgi:DNA-binding NarL/FixJ family response regulator
MRDGLCTLVAGVREFEIIAVASSPEEALGSSMPQSPAVIVGDFPSFKGSGLDAVNGMKARWPRARVLVLTFHSDSTTVQSAFRAGADGYLLKSDTCNELFTALRSIAAGKDFISPSVHGQVMSGYTTPERVADVPNPGLTERERQVIRLIAAGHRTREIAQMLSLSHKTIEKHRGSVMRKLGLRNASAVAAYAIAHGLA